MRSWGPHELAIHQLLVLRPSRPYIGPCLRPFPGFSRRRESRLQWWRVRANESGRFRTEGEKR